MEYISETNQEILWTIFHKLPGILQINYSDKESYFKQAISQVYESLPSNHFISKVELQELNKKTISILHSYLQLHFQNSDTIIEEYTIESKVYETKEDVDKRLLEERQKEYDRMVAKPNAPKPSELFQQEQEQEKNGAIQDMDKLIEEYQKQREIEFSPTTSILPQHSTDISSLLIRIKNLEDRIGKIEKTNQ